MDHYKKIVQIRIENMNARFEDRFWSRVEKTHECWNWTAAHKKEGYGKMSRHGRLQSAHRISWELANGSIPDGLWVLHKCDNPACVRPSHLYLGDHSKNTVDAVQRHRFRSGRRHWAALLPEKIRRGNECPQAKLDEAAVRYIRKHYRKYRRAGLAKRFGVGWGAIRQVITGKTWKHVKS